MLYYANAFDVSTIGNVQHSLISRDMPTIIPIDVPISTRYSLRLPTDWSNVTRTLSWTNPEAQTHPSFLELNHLTLSFSAIDPSNIQLFQCQISICILLGTRRRQRCPRWLHQAFPQRCPRPAVEGAAAPPEFQATAQAPVTMVQRHPMVGWVVGWLVGWGWLNNQCHESINTNSSWDANQHYTTSCNMSRWAHVPFAHCFAWCKAVPVAYKYLQMIYNLSCKWFLYTPGLLSRSSPLICS